MTNPAKKNKRIAVALSALPWGIFSWLYTYKTDSGRFWRNLASAGFWVGLSLGIWLLPDSGLLRDRIANLEANGVETELTHKLLLICVGGLTVIVLLESWLRALRGALKRPADWYAAYGEHPKKPRRERSVKLRKSK